MMIETANKTYLVIGYLGHDEEKDVYLCENRARERFLIIRLRDQRLVAENMVFLYEQVESERFTDLPECFVFEENLHLVFRCYQGEALEEKLQGEYTGLRERLELGLGLLEKMVLQSMPCYFQSRCLRPENIYVTRSLEVFFRYSVDDLEHHGDYTMEDVSLGLSRIMEELFREELKKQVLEPMEEFLDLLRDEPCEDYMELYRRYRTVYRQILELSEDEIGMPKTWIFRMWERIKKLFPAVKRAAVVAILLFGLGCLIWTIGDAAKPAKPASIITQIGTEEI
ncbi:hypothetical protein [Bacilliculturomica massiliensis]|uniref:hypothetical protein n=1 Tax=Bacilliculturomica massiliensis TaxID=1917867 RepID=UPI0010303069|nr:hypothetical protein [Bacilliculturomica massiliensis]